MDYLITPSVMHRDAKFYLAVLFEAFNMDVMEKPTILVEVTDSNYVGMFVAHDTGYNSFTSMGIFLNYHKIHEEALHNEEDLYTTLYSTVFHEFIHLLQYMSDQPVDHDTEFWHNMVRVGLDKGLIFREEI